MPKETYSSLSRRERQIMDILYRNGQATASEVMKQLPDPPTYSAVRAALRVLEQKGHIQHEYSGPRYVFTPTVSPEEIKQSASKHFVETFFKGSVENAVSALIKSSDRSITDEELKRISELIEKTHKEGR
ncbi:BlaI/MecI/CopY family transcriptional regulator [candidate division KSB1 bacterium]